ncbi:MAG: hypothetical protein U0U25_03535 [Flavobacteriales bacterium]
MRTLLLSVALLASLFATAQIDLSKIMAGQGVKVEDDKSPFVPNSFVGSFRMENHLYKNGVEEKHSPTTMRYWSSADMTLIKTEMPEQKDQDMRMMTDLKGKWQYMLMTDDKGGKTAMKSRKKTVTVDKEAEGKMADVTVTNETKVIDGHTCVKVVSKSSEGTWTGWVAKDLPSPFGDMLRNVKAGDPAMSERMSKLDGMTLEFEWTDANGKDSMRCYIKDVVVGTVDAGVFSLDGYEVMEMPSFGQ